jgi:hypothetical protein
MAYQPEPLHLLKIVSCIAVQRREMQCNDVKCSVGGVCVMIKRCKNSEDYLAKPKINMAK